MLAAGYARRFGSQKLLVVLPGGVSVLAASIANLAKHSDRLIVVIGADAMVEEAVRAMGCATVKNLRAEEGMGTSIAAGVEASRDSRGWLIALADMPYVQPNSLAAVKMVLAPDTTADNIVVPAYQGRQGHPVGFGSAYGEELAALAGDRGARALLARHPKCVKVLDLADPGVLQDIDLPSDIR